MIGTQESKIVAGFGKILNRYFDEYSDLTGSSLDEQAIRRLAQMKRELDTLSKAIGENLKEWEESMVDENQISMF